MLVAAGGLRSLCAEAALDSMRLVYRVVTGDVPPVARELFL